MLTLDCEVGINFKSERGAKKATKFALNIKCTFSYDLLLYDNDKMYFVIVDIVVRKELEKEQNLTIFYILLNNHWGPICTWLSQWLLTKNWLSTES